MNKLILYMRLIRIEKPIGYMLLLWPTLWGLWVAAEGWPGWPLFLIFSIGPVVMHSAGCAFNDFADRDFDRHVKRTRDRPLATGELAPWEAIMVGMVLTLLGLLMILHLNRLTLWLAVAAFLFAITYPWFKRFFAVPQAYLGLAFGFGIPMAFAAVRGTVPAVAWVMMIGNMFWTLAYDTEYAMVDRDDDLKIGMKTSAITFGQMDVAAVMLSYVLMLLIYVVIGLYLGLGSWYLAGLGAAGCCVVQQYLLIRKRERMKCHLAFRFNNLIGFLVFAGICLDYALR